MPSYSLMKRSSLPIKKIQLVTLKLGCETIFRKGNNRYITQFFHLIEHEPLGLGFANFHVIYIALNVTFNSKLHEYLRANKVKFPV